MLGQRRALNKWLAGAARTKRIASLCGSVAAQLSSPAERRAQLGAVRLWAETVRVERAACGFLEAALGIEAADECEQLGCALFD